MPCSLEITEDCRNEMRKHCHRNKVLEDAIRRKVDQILEFPYHFKPLHAPLHNKRRVHILGCFVLIYEILEDDKSVRLLAFSHHDDAY